MPNVPTVAEAGVPGYEATIWLGVMAPAKTPKPIIDKLNAEIVKVMNRPDVKEAWAKQGAVPMPMSPAEFDKYSARRYRKMGAGGQSLRRQARIGDSAAVKGLTTECWIWP